MSTETSASKWTSHLQEPDKQSLKSDTKLNPFKFSFKHVQLQSSMLFTSAITNNYKDATKYIK